MTLNLHRHLVLIVFFIISFSHSNGYVTLNTGNLRVVLSPQCGWTVTEILWNNRSIIEMNSSGQGTVFLIKGTPDVWAGSVHSNETVLETQLYIDGNSLPVTDNLSYGGGISGFVVEHCSVMSIY